MRRAYSCWILLMAVTPAPVLAGMPAPLPTPFTADKLPHSDALSPWVDDRLQALSFFLVVVLAAAWFVRGMWRLLRRDWPGLPALTYRGALVGTLLWGLLSVIVLTMISGARELMTPGAWRKNGWTYQLATAAPPADPHQRELRKERLGALRLALWKYAATHAGQFPAQPTEIPEPWAVPAHPGFEFVYRPGQSATAEAGGILVFEPEVGDAERFVLLTNGLIGAMPTPELEAALTPAAHVTNKDAP